MSAVVGSGMKRHLRLATASPQREEPHRLKVRRATRKDIDRISTLEWEENWVQEIYGFRLMADQFEHAMLCVVAEEDDIVQGYAVFNNYPDEIVVGRGNWKSWMKHAVIHSKNLNLSPAVCLFQTQLVCAQKDTKTILGAILTWLFSVMVDLQTVFHATRCDITNVAFLKELNFRVLSDYSTNNPVLSVDRGSLVPQLSTRQARLEDHDDLREMFLYDEESLKERYGNYFLAEVIADRKESSHSVVLEVDKLAVGIMSITTEVDYDLLNDNFELGPFNGLRKPHRKDVTGVESRMSGQVMGIRPSAMVTGTDEADDDENEDSSNADDNIDNAKSALSNVKAGSVQFANKTSTTSQTAAESQSAVDPVESSAASHAAEEDDGTVTPVSAPSSGAESTVTPVPAPSSGADTSSAAGDSSKNTNSDDGDDTVADDGDNTTGDGPAHEVAILEQVWGPGALEPGLGPQEQAPIPDDAVADGSRPVLEMIWGFPVSADGRVTCKVSSIVPGLSTVPVTGPAPEEHTIPVYTGAPNAAAICLFCVRDEHACRSLDLLPAILAKLPEIDYLLVTVPADEPETPLMDMFTRVPQRSRSTFPDELYIFHRASLITDFVVTPALSNDLGSIRTLVKHTESAEAVMLSVREMFLSSGAMQRGVHVVRCQEQVVGVVVVKPELNMDYLRSHFELEEYVAYDLHDPREGFGHLYHFHLNPIFQRFTHFILAEVMRLTTFSVLIYPMFPPCSSAVTSRISSATTESVAAGDDTDVDSHSPTAALERFWPVTWRRQIQYPLAYGTLGINVPRPAIVQRLDWHTLQVVTRGTVFNRRQRINNRLVVVGGGDAGLAVLEKLVFSRELLFTNVTLVDPHGFQGEVEGCPLVANMRTSTENFQKDRLATMWLHSWVNLVRGEMESIDRRRKCIMVRGAGEVPYDQLLLTCGLQLQLPWRSHSRPSQPFVDRRPLFASPQLPEAPENVFRVNSQFDAERALEYVRAYCLQHSENVVVYGRYLETLTCLSALIRLPVPLHRLVLVLPPDAQGKPTRLTDDDEVNRSIFHTLSSQENGIRILEGYTLTFWDTKSNNRLYRIQLTNKAADSASSGSERQSPAEPTERYLSCCGLFVYDRKSVEMTTFRALNNASLVFDGRLVIDHLFSTNDAYISAVGSMTKYSRRYHADNFDHSEYNARDIGHALGTQLLVSFGGSRPAVSGRSGSMAGGRLSTRARRRSSLSGQPLTPEFNRPLVTRAQLPGGWQLLQVTAPRPVLDLRPGWVLQTGDAVFSSATGYMRIEVSQWRVLQKITCYSQNEIETDNMIALYGLHEVLLNNMVARYQEGLIDDLYSYLRQPWAMMLFHDRFSVLLANIRHAMLNCRSRDRKLTLEEKIVDNLCRYSELSETEHIKILEDFRSGGIDQLVETWMLQYLASNKYHLPMYAREGTADALKINKDGHDPAAVDTGAMGSRAHLGRG